MASHIVGIYRISSAQLNYMSEECECHRCAYIEERSSVAHLCCFGVRDESDVPEVLAQPCLAGCEQSVVVCYTGRLYRVRYVSSL